MDFSHDDESLEHALQLAREELSMLQAEETAEEQQQHQLEQSPVEGREEQPKVAPVKQRGQNTVSSTTPAKTNPPVTGSSEEPSTPTVATCTSPTTVVEATSSTASSLEEPATQNFATSGVNPDSTSSSIQPDIPSTASDMIRETRARVNPYTRQFLSWLDRFGNTIRTANGPSLHHTFQATRFAWHQLATALYIVLHTARLSIGWASLVGVVVLPLVMVLVLLTMIWYQTSQISKLTLEVICDSPAMRFGFKSVGLSGLCEGLPEFRGGTPQDLYADPWDTKAMGQLFQSMPETQEIYWILSNVQTNYIKKMQSEVAFLGQRGALLYANGMQQSLQSLSDAVEQAEESALDFDATGKGLMDSTQFLMNNLAAQFEEHIAMSDEPFYNNGISFTTWICSFVPFLNRLTTSELIVNEVSLSAARLQPKIDKLIQKATLALGAMAHASESLATFESHVSYEFHDIETKCANEDSWLIWNKPKLPAICSSGHLRHHRTTIVKLQAALKRTEQDFNGVIYRLKSIKRAVQTTSSHVQDLSITTRTNWTKAEMTSTLRIIAKNCREFSSATKRWEQQYSAAKDRVISAHYSSFGPVDD